jgi:hypothetical protein
MWSLPHVDLNSQRTRQAEAKRPKVFWFFFSEKNSFGLLGVARYAPAQ